MKETASIEQVMLATKRFRAEGWCCTESVAMALAEAQGLDTPLLPRLASAFCGGIGRTGSTCGALSGAVMGISLAFGRNHPQDSADNAHQATQALIREFEKRFGSCLCNELTGCHLDTPEGRQRFTQNELRERCNRFCIEAAEIAQELILAPPALGSRAE